MPSFVSAAQDSSSPTHYRDGYLMLFVFLPVSFGDQFVRYIADTLPPILQGLADQSEYLRETALLAGQTIINRYASKAVELFLPQLENGEELAQTQTSRYWVLFLKVYLMRTGASGVPQYSCWVTYCLRSVANLEKCQLNLLKMTTLVQRRLSMPSYPHWVSRGGIECLLVCSWDGKDRNRIMCECRTCP